MEGQYLPTPQQRAFESGVSVSWGKLQPNLGTLANPSPHLPAYPSLSARLTSPPVGPHSTDTALLGEGTYCSVVYFGHCEATD